MGPIFAILPCKDCGVATTLPLRVLPDITQRRTRPATDGDFVNFVCPNCGLGSLHLAGKLEKTEAASFSSLVRPPIYCAFLKCSKEHCTLGVKVHTLAQSGAQDAEPKKAAHSWKVAALECLDGHHAQEPAGTLSHHVLDPEPE